MNLQFPPEWWDGVRAYAKKMKEEKKMKDTTYNGWKNRQTWNVMLWINNDFGIYWNAMDFMATYKGRTPYRDWARQFSDICETTGDGVRWLDKRLSYRELNHGMREIVGK